VKYRDPQPRIRVRDLHNPMLTPQAWRRNELTAQQEAEHEYLQELQGETGLEHPHRHQGRAA